MEMVLQKFIIDDAFRKEFEKVSSTDEAKGILSRFGFDLSKESLEELLKLDFAALAKESIELVTKNADKLGSRMD